MVQRILRIDVRGDSDMTTRYDVKAPTAPKLGFTTTDAAEAEAYSRAGFIVTARTGGN